jgi:hypothetical protein
MDAQTYLADTIRIEQQELDRCQKAANGQVTHFEVWHSDDGGTIIECYRLDTKAPIKFGEQPPKEKVFVVYRFKFGSPFNE